MWHSNNQVLHRNQQNDEKEKEKSIHRQKAAAHLFVIDGCHKKQEKTGEQQEEINERRQSFDIPSTSPTEPKALLEYNMIRGKKSEMLKPAKPLEESEQVMAERTWPDRDVLTGQIFAGFCHLVSCGQTKTQN